MPPRKEPEPPPATDDGPEYEEELATLEDVKQLEEKLNDLVQRVSKLEGRGSARVGTGNALLVLEESSRNNLGLRMIYDAIVESSTPVVGEAK